MHHLKVLSALALSALAAAADHYSDDLPASSAPQSFCSEFETTGNYTREFGNSSYVRISPGIICSQDNATDGSCPVLAGGYFELNSRYNITNAIEYQIDWAIYSATGDYNLYFAHPDFGGVDNSTLQVPWDSATENHQPVGTTSAYIVFQPRWRCISGQLNGCPSGVKNGNGTYIEACYPVIVEGEEVGGFNEYDGIKVVHLTNASYAASATTNPNAQPPPGLVQSGAAANPKVGGIALGLVVGVMFCLL